MRKEINKSSVDTNSRARLSRRVYKFFTKKKTIRTTVVAYNLEKIISRAAIIGCCILGIRCFILENSNTEYEIAFNSIINTEINAGLATAADDHSPQAVANRYQTNVNYYSQIKYYDDILTEKLNNIILDMAEMDVQNFSLAASNIRYYNQLEEFSLRSELYDKYEYALYRPNGERNDITFNQLVTAESIMVKNGLNPNLLFAIIMTESEGVEDAKNSSSTAAGYGQILASTGEATYEILMGNGNNSFNYSMLYDGTTNIEICANYLDYLVDNNDNIYSVIEGYRGKKDPAYCKKLNYYLNFANTSLSQLNNELYGDTPPVYQVTTANIPGPDIQMKGNVYIATLPIELAKTN